MGELNQKGSPQANSEGWRPDSSQLQARPRTHPAPPPCSLRWACMQPSDLLFSSTSLREGPPVLNIFEILLRFRVKNHSAFKAKRKFGRRMCFHLRFKRQINILTIALCICIFLFKWKQGVMMGKHPIKTEDITQQHDRSKPLCVCFEIETRFAFMSTKRKSDFLIKKKICFWQSIIIVYSHSFLQYSFV